MTTTTIEGIWGSIRGIVATYESVTDGVKYDRSRDPFSFEMDLRGDAPAFYVEPPQIDDGVQFVGGERALLARCSIWLSRPRGDEPDRQAIRLATDAGELRRLIDGLGMDWLISPGSASVRISTGDEGDVTVIGSLSIILDVEEVNA